LCSTVSINTPSCLLLYQHNGDDAHQNYAELSSVSELLYAARADSFASYILSQVLNSDQTFIQRFWGGRRAHRLAFLVLRRERWRGIQFKRRCAESNISGPVAGLRTTRVAENYVAIYYEVSKQTESIQIIVDDIQTNLATPTGRAGGRMRGRYKHDFVNSSTSPLQIHICSSPVFQRHFHTSSDTKHSFHTSHRHFVSL